MSGDLNCRKPVELVFVDNFKWSARSLSTTSHWSRLPKTSSHVRVIIRGESSISAAGMVVLVLEVADKLSTISCSSSSTTANCDLCCSVVVLSVSLLVHLNLMLSPCLTSVCVCLIRLRLPVLSASVCSDSVCLSYLRLSVRMRLSGLPRSSDMPLKCRWKRLFPNHPCVILISKTFQT